MLDTIENAALWLLGLAVHLLVLAIGLAPLIWLGVWAERSQKFRSLQAQARYERKEIGWDEYYAAKNYIWKPGYLLVIAGLLFAYFAVEWGGLNLHKAIRAFRQG